MHRYSDLQKLKKIVQICRVNSILDENANSNGRSFSLKTTVYSRPIHFVYNTPIIFLPDGNSYAHIRKGLIALKLLKKPQYLKVLCEDSCL